MSEKHCLTLEQLDSINLSLSKAIAIIRMVANCSCDRTPLPGNASDVNHLFVVMQVVLDELEQVAETVQGAGRG